MHDKIAFKPEIVSENVPEGSPPNIQHEDSGPEADHVVFEDTDFSEYVEDLARQLKHNVAALFLKH